MSLHVEQYLPFAVLILILFSLRPNQPSFRNFAAVVVGALTAWIATPADSPWGMAICLGLLALAVAMSPFMSPLSKAARSLRLRLSRKKATDKIPERNPEPVRSLKNPKPINILLDPSDAKMDVVAVHGLGSSVETTWMHKESQKLWLRDFLGQDLPKARIMTFRHNSKWWADALVKDLTGYGKQLLSALEAERNTEEARDRPLILIGHSFGGLLIEQALVIAKRSVADPNIRERHTSLTNSLAGVIFLGTPHAGSGYSTIGKLYCLFNYWQGASTMLLRYMDPGSKETREVEDEFLSGYDEVPSIDYYESRPNIILGFRVNLVVTENAATRPGRPSEPLDTDHFGLNKYETKEDASYLVVKNKIVEMVDSKIKRIQEEIDNFEDASNQEFLKSLKPYDFIPIIDERHRKLTPGTCQWISCEKEFQAWNSENNVLWILGNPGSGKSFIAHYIWEYLKEENRNLMYFFFDAKSAEAKDLRSLKKFYQTILHQLLKGIPRTNSKLRAKCFTIVRRRILEEDQNDKSLKGAIRDVLTMVQPSFLVVDALDECKDADPEILKEWLAEIKTFPKLQIVITSRSLQSTKPLANDPLYIHLQLNSVIDKSNDDIRLFIVDRIQKSEALPPEIPRVVKELRRKSNGMILYARLMLDILEDKAGDEDDLLKEMEKLPLKLSELYADRLKQIKDKKFATKIFQWLVTCKRPPTVDGLQGVDTISRAIERTNQFELDRKNPPQGLGKDRFLFFLLKECLPLVEVLQDDTVRLVHTTVSQFLKGEDVEEDSAPCPSAFRVQLVDSHEFIAVTCVTYLRWDFGMDERFKPDFLNNEDLREYAVLEWSNHSQKSEEQIMGREKEKEVLVSFCQEEAFQAWLAARATLDNPFSVHFGFDGNQIYPKPLHIAVFFNMWRLGRLFLQDINERDGTGSTALHIAAGQDYPLIVQDLLREGARMDIPDINGSFPLHRAVRRGNHSALAKLVSSNKADVNVHDKYKFTPMHVACQLGWTKCVKILLDHDAKVQNESNAIETPIGLAIENGHTEVVRALLGREKSLITHCGKPLVQAARRGSSEMVKFLREAGADISYQDLLGQTALHKACISRNKDLVKYLLGMGVPVDPLDRSQRTPLYFAAERGYLDIVNCLIEHDANVNSLDRRRETALFKPAGNGHVGVVERLLDAGTDATILDFWDRTPLRFAAMKGHGEIVRILLERTKINQDLPDWAGRSVLHNAAAYLRQGQEHVIDLLIQHKAQLDQRGGKDGGTALHAAILRVSDQPPPTKALIDRLVQNKVPINARDKYGRTALYLAATTRNLEVVELLLNSGAMPNDNSLLAAVRSGSIALVRPFLNLKSGLNFTERSRSGESALHTAAAQGYDDIVAELLAAGAPTRCLDMNKMTPFMTAEKMGKSGAMHLLQSADPAPDGDYDSRVAKNMWGRCLLHWAAEDGQDLEKYILGDSALNSQDDVGRTALHLAVLSGSLNTVRQLLSVQADMKLADELGQTPLHYAAERVDPGILEALVTAGAHVDAVDKWSRTPLHLAAQKGYSAVAHMLLTADAELQTDYEKHTALHLAALEGHSQAVRILLESERVRREMSQQNARGRTVLHLASEYGRSEILANLLEYIRDPTIIDARDVSGMTALHLASQNGHLDIVQWLIKAGSVAYRVDNDRNMTVHLAAESGHEEIVATLLDAIPDHVEHCLKKWDQHFPEWASEEEGADAAFREVLVVVGALVKGPREWEVAPEEWTLQNRQTLKSKVILGLQTWDKERHSIPSTALMRAVLGGHANVVKLILQKVPKMPLQAQHYSYANVLSLAASKGDTEIARLLIAAGSDVNAITDTQETCLHEAAENGHAQVIELLLQQGANPDLARLRDGSTPLHLAAAERGHADAVKALVRLAFVNVSDDLGRTALHRACQEGHEAVVDLLLDADADVLAQDFEQKTPLAVASELSEKTRLNMQEQATKQKLRQTAGH